MKTKLFNKTMSKILTGFVDFSQGLWGDLVLNTDEINEDAEVIGDLSNLLGSPKAINTIVTEEGRITTDTTSLGYSVTSTILVSGLVIYDSSNQLIAFLNFGQLREVTDLNGMRIDLPEIILDFSTKNSVLVS